tara:strand:- start:1403 stop:2413 length:1011 start_codon:yes stop_codon:yes gene_type:complete
MKKLFFKFSALLLLTAVAGCQNEQAAYVQESTFQESCNSLPLETNRVLTLAAVSNDWFQVYESHDQVYSIVEPYQFQMSISHLIVGNERAVLFDTGMGIFPIRPIVEGITDLPVLVVNSHTHFDHVGGNNEFSDVLAIDSDYTKSNMKGFEHKEIAGDVIPAAFCGGAPAGFDVETYHTKSWNASRYVEDGHLIDLGGRTLEILHVPGHTPDATALVDRENGLLFTGDTFYDDNIWLFAPETNIDDYSSTIDRLVDIESATEYLFGAHSSARVDAGRLSQLQSSLRKLRSGKVQPFEQVGKRLIYVIDGITFVTAKEVLDGRQGDITIGGSGFGSW